MSVPKHTPGPWLADARLTGGSISVTQQTNPNMQIARVNGRAGEQEANARLIAAAPDLLEALRAARTLPGLCGISRAPLWLPGDLEAAEQADKEIEKVVRLMDAAIAKAIGEGA